MRKILLALLPAAAFLLGTATAQAEETNRSFTDDLGRSVSIPAKPKRIVTLHDIDLTIPLIDWA